MVAHDPGRDARAFEPVVAAVEEIAPGVEVVRPGACALAARGPASYYGGEAAASERLADVADRLRVQAIHGDVTDDNVVGHADAAGRIRPDGVIDFGDLTRSWLVGDIAVTAASILRHGTDDPFVVLPAIRAFHELVPLDDADVAALWPLVVLRGAVLVASGEHQAMLDPENRFLYVCDLGTDQIMIYALDTGHGRLREAGAAKNEE